MSKARVAVLKVATAELSVTAAAAEYGYSRQHLHRLLARYRDGGLDAVEPRFSPTALQPVRHNAGGARTDRRVAAAAE